MIQHVIQVSKWQNALPDALKGINFAWLEITKKCPLECKHCYVASSPRLSHGVMQADDWKHTMDQLKDLGCKAVQFIGGEPSIHPSFCDLLAHAAQLGFSVEVYSNLVGITSRMWSLFVEHKIKLACSFYSDQPSIHDQITKTPGSFQRTFANIEKALSLGLTLRVGMIDMQDGQRMNEGKALLEAMGISQIKVDRIRGVGRGDALNPENPVEALCGQCANGKCAITASGEVFPCVFARTFMVGNVRENTLRAIVYGTPLTSVRKQLSRAFATRATAQKDCDPDSCAPDIGCDPDSGCDPDACSPQWCNPDEECSPNNPPPCVPSCAPCIPDLN